jgi:uncharacterized protein YcaQ
MRCARSCARADHLATAIFVGQRVTNYREGKDTTLALHYLWLTGELMIHHRQGFERV